MNYKETIREIAETLKAKYNPEKIVLFGSCASGRVTRDSDIDMLVIKDTEKTYGQRWMEVSRLTRSIEKSLPFEPFVLTPEELKKESKRNFFLQEILKKGKVLYERI